MNDVGVLRSRSSAGGFCAATMEARRTGILFFLALARQRTRSLPALRLRQVPLVRRAAGGPTPDHLIRSSKVVRVGSCVSGARHD